MKKFNPIIQYTIYGVLAVSVILVIYLFYKVNHLNDELEVTQQRTDSLLVYAAYQDKIKAIDSLLLEGNYVEAEGAYRLLMKDSLPFNRNTIDLRLRLSAKLQEMQSQLSTSQEEPEARDTLDLSITENIQQVNLEEYDSLVFALEKIKVQLETAKEQLVQKSYGQYLTFQSSKGNKIHYVGQAEGGKASGYGIGILETGSRYEGFWKDNMRDGKGTFYWPDGAYYVGQFVNDRRSGEGTYHWPNGQKFVGEWQNDQRNGFGIFFGEDGQIIAKGIWKNDELVEKQD